MIASRLVLCLTAMAAVASADVRSVIRPCKPATPPATRTSLVFESVLSPDKISLSDQAVPIGADIKTMIEVKRMELRLRVEYRQRDASAVVTTYLAATDEPMPSPRSPGGRDGTILQMIEFSVESVRDVGADSGTFALFGVIRTETVPWSGAPLPTETPLSVLVRFERGSDQATENLTVAWPGGSLAAARGVAKLMCVVVAHWPPPRLIGAL